jgi:hypothetical protein
VKLTRRQLVIAAAGSVAAANAAAQSVPVPAPASAPASAPSLASAVADPNQQALDDLRQSADDLAKVTIPMDVAPAFQFKA